MNINPINVNTIKLDTLNLYIEDIYDDTLEDVYGDLKAIKINNSTIISLGDKVPIKLYNPNNKEDVFKTHYKIRNIQKCADYYLLHENVFLEQSYFLLPCVAKPYFLNQYFINCYKYINHEDWKDKDDLLYVVYKFSPFEAFTSLDNRLIKEKNYVTKIKDGSYNIYIFKINSFTKDVSEYLNNNYRNISYKYRDKLLVLYGDLLNTPWVKTYALHPEHYIYKLLFKEDVLRKEMSEVFGYSISMEDKLINKPNKKDLTWKISQ